MSAVNQGNQTITFDYKNIGTGDSFNKLLKNLIKPGIYKIASAITNSGNTISIPAFTAGLNVDTDKFIHVSTTSVVTQTAVEANGDVLVITYSWGDTAENWLDFQWRNAASDPYDNEIILCQVTYSGGIVNSIDLTVQTKGLFVDEDYNIIVDTSLSIGKNSNPSYTLDVNGTFNLTGAATLNSTLETDGAVILNSTLDITGTTTLNSTLTVTGTATLESTLIVTDNLGLGISNFLSWGSSNRIIELGGNASFIAPITRSAGNSLNLYQNAYYDGSNNRYISTDEASIYQQGSGQHIFYTSSSGSADDIISFIISLLINVDGDIDTSSGSHIGIGGNHNNSYNLYVTGNGYISTSLEINTTLQVNSTTDATDKDTGSIVSEGGIAAEKVIYSGKGFHGPLKGSRVILDYTAGVTTEANVYDGFYEVIPAQAGFFNCTGGVNISGTIYPIHTIAHNTTPTPDQIEIYYVNSSGSSAVMVFRDGESSTISYSFVIKA